MVFQSYALYPHMTVKQNMSFGLKQAKTAVDEIERRVSAAAEILQIDDYLERSPRNLWWTTPTSSNWSSDCARS